MKKLLLVAAAILCFSSAVDAQALSASITTHINASCNGNSNGALTVTATGGSGSYTYAWAPGGQTTAAITNLPAGTYVATVDDGSTTFTVSATITQPNALVATANGGGICQGSTFNLCAMGSGGTSPYAFSWSPASSLSSPAVACPTSSATVTTTYTVTIVDANGCTAMYSSTVFVNSIPNVTANSGAICMGSTINLVANGANTYAWTPGASLSCTTCSNPVASPIATTVYTVTGTSVAGCTATATSTVTVNPNPTPVATNGGPYCEGTNIMLACNALGGGTTYMWAGPNGYSSALQNPTIGVPATLAMAGTYTIYATDPNGCVGMATTNVIVNANPVPSVISIVEPGCGASNGSFTCSASGGNPPYVYSGAAPGLGMWGPTANATQTGITIGTWTVCVTDANGCMSCQGNYATSDSCDLVWPGDANDDLIVDNNDLLAISLGNGNTWSPRAGGITWNGFPAFTWGTSVLGTSNDKHIDCDGNGIIDLNDTNAVIQNYGLTRPASKHGTVFPTGGTAPLEIDIVQDSLSASSSGNILVSLGDAVNAANNIYGIAFTINFDASVIDPASFSINGSGSWMGTQNSDMMSIVLNDGVNGKAQAVVARYDHNNVSGNGLIANMGFMTKSNYTGTQNVQFTLSNITLIDNANNQTTVALVNDSVVAVDPLTTGIQPSPSASLHLFPNPARESVTIFAQPNSLVEIFDVTGNVVKRVSLTSTATVLSLNGISKGIYFIRSLAGNKISAAQKLVVE